MTQASFPGNTLESSTPDQGEDVLTLWQKIVQNSYNCFGGQEPDPADEQRALMAKFVHNLSLA